MLTPGLAGALTMMISNALTHAFGLNPAWTALALSFLLGMVVWVATAALLARCIYYVCNSLIIFSVAFGTNSFGFNANVPTASFSLTSAAYAQTPTNTKNGTQAGGSSAEINAMLNTLLQNAAKSGTNDPAVIAQKKQLSALIVSKTGKSAQVKSNAVTPVPAQAPNKTPGFFQPWRF